MGILSNLAKAYLFYNDIKSSEKTISHKNDLMPFNYKLTNNTNDIRLMLGDGTSYYTNAYDLCPAVGLSVQKKANSITRGKLICVDADNKPINQTQGYKKAFELLQRPNIFQNYSQFICSIETYINIYGACYLYLIPSVVRKGEIIGIIPIPNKQLTVYYKKQVNVFANQTDIVDYYYINLYGETFKIDGEQKKNIYTIYDSKINLLNIFQPSSRLDAVRTNVENIIASIDSRNTIITKRGAEGILSPEKSNDTAGVRMSLDDKERERLQKEWSKYGILSSQFNTLITKVAMKYQAISRPVAELGLFDGENADYRTISSCFGVPVPLLSLPDTTKYNTYLEAKTEFYEDTIIPESTNITEAFDYIFKTKEQGYKFYLDYSHLSCMQTSEKDRANTFGQIITALNSAVESGLMDINDAKIMLEDYK